MHLVLRLFLLLAAVVLPASAQSGLVAAFPCDEGSGTTIRDVAATHHIGTLGTGVTWTTAGKFGKALVFNGSNAMVTVPDHPQLALTTGATVMAWVYPTALSSYRTIVLKEVSGGAGYFLYSNGTQATGGGGFNGGTYREVAGGAAIPLNTWTHLAMTYDGSNLRMYRNGTLVATVASTGPFDATAGPLRLGGNSIWSEWWQGRIDEVRIYNRALSATEITTDSNTQTVPFPTPPVVAGTAPSQGATVQALSQIDVQFDEPVGGVDATDLLVDGVAATGMIPLGANTYRFTFPARPPGPVSVAFATGHSIADFESPVAVFQGASWSYTVDPNAPLEQVRINEVVTVGVPGGLADADGDFEDWVELYNNGTSTVNLAGWALSYDVDEPAKWIFPSRTLAPGGYLVVFLSGKNRTPASGPLHTNFNIDRSGGRLLLYNGGQPRQLVSAFDPIPAQQPGISYGIGSGGQNRFFATPTPSAVNAGTEYNGIAEAPVPSVAAGYYTAPFSLALTSTTPGAAIRYTTDGTPPTAASPLYSAPLTIGATTVVRAAAFAPNFATSDVTTRTYLFLADVLSQSTNGAAPPGWPATWGSNRVDYGMDLDVIGPGAPYQSRALGAMQAIPALSIVMKLPDLFDSTTGIYANAGQNGDAWERPASLELLRPDGQGGFQENGGLRIRGNFSRDNNNPKHSFRMFFRERYGSGKLNYPLFGPTGADKHDVVDLRTSQDFSWAYLASTEATFVTDSFARDLMGAMGQQTTRGDFYHLFINGQYWGLYNTEERVNPSYAKAYLGGEEADYDVVKVDSFNTQLAAGTFTAWTQLWNLTEAGVASDAALQALLGNNPDGTRNPALPIHLDAVNLCDYMLMNFIIDNRDGPIYIDGNVPNNFFGVRPRDGRAGWRFFAHDSEYSMFSVNGDVTGPPTSVGATITSSNARRMWEKCMANAEFRQLFADRVQKHCFGNGALTPAGQAAIWQARAAQIDQAVIGESARWGDSNRTPQQTPLSRDEHWLPRINFFLNSWFPTRTGIVISQLQARGYFPSLAAPVLSPQPGTVAPGTVVTLTQTAPVGVIYYTLNGTDPRSFGGGLNPAAQVWQGSLALLSSTKLRARVRDGASWSPLIEADFFLAQDLTKLAVSELMFNAPGDGTTDGAEFEFIELTNTGAQPLDLAGLAFIEGIEGTFPLGTTIAPGGFVVAVRNPTAFASRYPGVPVALTFTGKLDNGGEAIALSSPAGGVIFRLTYNNAPPWPAAASGLGYSIVNLAPETFTAPEEGRRWRASSAPYGSPGAADAASPQPLVVVGELLAGPGGFIELHNPGTSPVDIGGWGVTDDPLVPAKAVVATGTTIPANGAVQFTAASLGFSPNPLGGSVFVFARSGGALTGYGHGWKFGATDAAFALGRVVDSTGEESLVPLAAATPGALAATPQIGPVVIHEIWYHPPVGYFEAVELRNISTSPVALDGWRLDGFGYTFPAGATIPANGYLLVVTDTPAAFRARHGVPVAVPILGPAVGLLENSGERLSLERPSTLGVGAFVTLESLRYNDKAPWPTTADGSGPSLQRISVSVLALEPTNWQGQGLTLGAANTPNAAPSISITSPAHLSTFTPPGSLTINADASDPDGQIALVEFYDGSTKLGEDTAAPYSLAVSGLAAGEHWLTARAVDNSFGGTTSIPVLVAGMGSVPFIASPWGATWRYLDNGVAPPANWKVLSFDDGAWKSGAAELGYGDNDEATVVEDDLTPGYQAGSTNRYITTWFRRTFTVADAAQVTALSARMIRDDGVAVYLNGTEIWRDNLVAGAGPTTGATNAISGTDESLQLTKMLNPADLVEGTNVLAVEVHQQTADSSDISFNFELLAERPSGIPNPDTDGDGMRDAWEIANGFAYWNAADGAGDADGDGTLNVTEFRLGLDPRNPGQTFRAAVSKAAGTGFVVTWPAAAGVQFAVQRSPSLSAPNWQTIGTVTTPGATGTFTDSAPLAGQSFYRVRFTQ